MSTHKDRAGRVLVSGLCRQTDHEGCREQRRELSALGADFACHCSCHPDDGCRDTVRKVQHRRNTVCPKCHLAHAGEC